MQPNESEAAMKQLSNVGGTIMAFGLISVVLSLVVTGYLVAVGALPAFLVIPLSTSFIFGLTFTILGYRVYKEHSRSSKGKLIAVIIISAFIFIVNLLSGSVGASTSVPIILIISGIWGLNIIKKLPA